VLVLRAHAILLERLPEGSLEGKIVKILLESGADADKAAEEGVTPLFIASQEGKLKIVKCLVEVGKAEVDEADNGGVTPLYIASQKGKLDVVKYLVEEGKAENG